MSKAARLSFVQTAPFALVLILSLVAFYFTSAEYPPLIAAVAVALSEMVRIRLPHSRMLALALRLAAFTPIFLHLGIPPESFPQWYLKPSYTTLVGCLLSAEAAIRAWEPPGGLLSGDQRGVMFFMSALLIAGAANTNERVPMNIFAPAYVVLAIIALRSFDARPWRVSLLQAMRMMLVAVVLAGGYRLARAITQYDDVLNSYVERLFFQRRFRREIGLSTSPRLGSIYNPLQSMDRIMLVQGSLSERYLAAAEFDRFHDSVWGPEVTSRPFISADPRALRANAIGTKLTFMRVGSNFNLLPLPLNSASVESVAGVEQDEFGALRHTEQDLTGGSSLYTAIVAKSETAQGPLTPPLQETQRKASLQLPDHFDQQAIDLSQQITAGHTDAGAVMRLANHLRSTHGYSLSYHAEGNEPISAFILHNSAAHCEYFASALVMMCRASGIPARLVTGYYAHERFTGDTLVVRGRDAHAWAEAWIDGIGWFSIDATPAGGRPDALNEQSSWFRRTWERISDWPGYFRDWISKFSADVITVIVCSVAGLLFLAFVVRVIWLRRAARRRALANEYAKRDKRLTHAARQFDRWLARSGSRCNVTATWRDCLPQVPQAQRFVDAYELARFGPADESATRTALQELRELRLQQMSRRRPSAITSSEKEAARGR